MRPLPSPQRVLRYEVMAFAILLVTVWIASLIPILIDRRASMDWEDPILETLVVLAVAIPTVVMSNRIIDRLYYLESFLRLCAWCHRVNLNDEWIPIEDFLKRRLSTQTSHGICESCNRIIRKEIQARKRGDDREA